MSERQSEIQARSRDATALGNRLQAQKKLTLEYYTLLTQAEKENERLRDEHLRQQEQAEARIRDMEDQLNQAEKENERLRDEHLQQQEQAEVRIQDLEDQLQDQSNLTLKYFQSLSDAESEHVQLHSQVQALEDHNRQLRAWMSSLQSDVEALLLSRRWRVANNLGRMAGLFSKRFRRPGSVQRMQGIFAKFDHLEALSNKTVMPNVLSRDNSRQVIKWMDRLDKEFQAVLRSRRWRLGNALVSGVSKLVGRSIQLETVHRMKEIFAEFQSWKQSVNSGALSKQESKQLTKWMDRLEKDFQALRVSRRWRLGNALLVLSRLVFWREKKPKPMDRVQEIFEQYNS